MSELVEFVTRMLDEDEATARAAFASNRDEEGDPNWRAHRQKSLIPNHIARWQVVSVAESWEDPGYPAERVAELMIGGGNEEERPTAEFIARHDPARVLAEVKAKRAIVAAFVEEGVRKDIFNRGYDEGLLTTDDDRRQRLSSNARWAGLEVAVRLLASVWVDAPGFREEWR